MEERQAYIDELISVSLSGSLTPEEQETLDAWMAESETNRKYLMRYREIWFSSLHPQEPARYNEEKAFAAFKSRIDRKKHEQAARKGRTGWKRCYKYAAAILLLGMVSYFSFRGGERHLHNALAEVHIEAPVGSQTRLHLPDGTLVLLNAGSHITYSQNFGVEARFVKLQGEGYFEVAHNARMPFRVQAKDLEVRVLGTKFNFRDYPEDKKASVSLIEGKVALNNLLRKEAEVILSPNERVELDKQNGVMVKESMETAPIEWTQGRLTFQEIPLSEVAEVLARNYGVNITFADDSLKNVRLYGDFSGTEQSLQDILDALSATNRVHYVLKEKDIILY